MVIWGGPLCGITPYIVYIYIYIYVYEGSYLYIIYIYLNTLDSMMYSFFVLFAAMSCNLDSLEPKSFELIYST